MPRSTQAPAAVVVADEDSSAAPARLHSPARLERPWKRVAASFFLMLGIYASYALAIVPFIEPSADPRPQLDEDPAAVEHARNLVEMQRQALTPWFSPGDWELTSPKVFESPRGKLLLHEYEQLEDGRLSIRPCTMIFLSDDPTATEEERNRKAVILQAPEGAILKFDTPVDLKQGKIGKLVGGTMIGPILIRSDQQLPGPQDDLHITTRDAELIGDRIVTAYPVDFRLGPNRGNGRDLEIRLAPSETPAPNSPAPGFGGINSLTLKQDVRMRLHPGQADMFPGAAPTAPSAMPNRAAESAAEAKENPPVDIACEGAFVFDVLRYAATFERKVDVLRVNVDGPSDQLTCELLSVFFEPAQSATPTEPQPAAPRRGFPKLEPSRIEAEGNPVVIRSPSRGVQARGTRMEYDVKKNAGHLRGPGWLRGTRPEERGPRAIEATWNGMLDFGPAEGIQTAELSGAAHVESIGVGWLNAETIRLFFIEEVDQPANPSGRRRLVPDRLQAFGRVHFQSPTLSGDVVHLQVWLDRPNAGAVPAATSIEGSAASPGASTDSANPLDPSAPAAAPTQHFHVAGELLQVKALVGEKTSSVSRVHIEGKAGDAATRTQKGQVVLRETQVAEAGARPMVVMGDQVDVEEDVPNHSIVHVLGRPAHIEAREMVALDGRNIHLDRGRNRAWVDGQGLMIFLAASDLANQPVAEPRPVEITWKGNMDFDGRAATFEGGVVTLMDQQRLTPEGIANHENQRLTCDRMQALFEPRIMFADVGPRSRPQVSRVVCQGNVFLERRTTVGGRPTALERVQSIDLEIQPASGDLSARGPGWVRRVWIDTGRGLPGLQVAQTAPAVPEKSAEHLAYLGIDFHSRLTGNQQRQMMDFYDKVRCVYGQVPDWDTILEPDDPDKLGNGGTLLTSNELHVVQTPAVANQRPGFELRALGNARLDGRASPQQRADDKTPPAHPKSKGTLYAATAERLTYVSDKDLLVLEGDGRNRASLSRQERVGGPFDEQYAGKFMFWPSTNRVQVQDAHELNIENLRGAGSRPAQTQNGAPPAKPAATPAAVRPRY
jgi:hypothetical protein